MDEEQEERRPLFIVRSGFLCVDKESRGHLTPAQMDALVSVYPSFHRQQEYDDDDIPTVKELGTTEDELTIGSEPTDDGICEFCYAKKANALILSCQECIVCKACALRLDNGINQDTCILCQRPIQQELY